MSYEARIGWRYLYGGKRDPFMFKIAIFFALVTLIGLGQVVLSKGDSPYGVIELVAGMLATSVFILLSVFSVFTSVSICDFSTM